MNIIFFHIATILPNYQRITDEIMNSIFDGGIISEIEEINISVVGTNKIKLPKNEKIKIIFKSENVELFEFPILNIIKNYSKMNNCNILYMHTKGASKSNKCIDDWRKYMLYFNVYKYKDAVEKLKEYDTYGVDLRNNPTLHYSGNFWWGRSEYIRTLPEFSEMKTIISERHKAEFWICYNKGKHYNAWDCGIDVYKRHLYEYPENMYKK